MIYCSVKFCFSNSSIPGVILHSIMKSIKTPNHPAYYLSTLWPLEVWVRGFLVILRTWAIYVYLFIYDNNRNLTSWVKIEKNTFKVAAVLMGNISFLNFFKVFRLTKGTTKICKGFNILKLCSAKVCFNETMQNITRENIR